LAVGITAHVYNGIMGQVKFMQGEIPRQGVGKGWRYPAKVTVAAEFIKMKKFS